MKKQGRVDDDTFRRKMNKIKFSHTTYRKLDHIGTSDPVMLLQVLEGFDTNLSQSFIDYDTTYGNNEQYELPKGRLIILVFKDLLGYVFTTIRRWTPKKEAYYKEQMGEYFEVVFT